MEMQPIIEEYLNGNLAGYNFLAKRYGQNFLIDLKEYLVDINARRIFTDMERAITFF